MTTETDEDYFDRRVTDLSAVRNMLCRQGDPKDADEIQRLEHQIDELRFKRAVVVRLGEIA